jgi:hypothetical protein
MCATAALAACAAPGPDYAGPAARLDQAREEIAPPLGATTYTLDSGGLLDQPGDENRSLRNRFDNSLALYSGRGANCACAVSSRRDDGARGVRL